MRPGTDAGKIYPSLSLVAGELFLECICDLRNPDAAPQGGRGLREFGDSLSLIFDSDCERDMQYRAADLPAFL